MYKLYTNLSKKSENKLSESCDIILYKVEEMIIEKMESETNLNLFIESLKERIPYLIDYYSDSNLYRYGHTFNNGDISISLTNKNTSLMVFNILNIIRDVTLTKLLKD